MEPWKTNQTRWEWHRNTFHHPFPPVWESSHTLSITAALTIHIPNTSPGSKHTSPLYVLRYTIWPWLLLSLSYHGKAISEHMLSWASGGLVSMDNVILIKWQYSTKQSAWESLQNSSSSTITISEYNTHWFMLSFCIWIIIASCYCGGEKKERKSEDRWDLPVLATCHSGTSVMLSS